MSDQGLLSYSTTMKGSQVWCMQQLRPMGEMVSYRCTSPCRVGEKNKIWCLKELKLCRNLFNKLTSHAQRPPPKQHLEASTSFVRTTQTWHDKWAVSIVWSSSFERKPRDMFPPFFPDSSENYMKLQSQTIMTVVQYIKNIYVLNQHLHCVFAWPILFPNFSCLLSVVWW